MKIRVIKNEPNLNRYGLSVPIGFEESPGAGNGKDVSRKRETGKATTATLP